jgi:hypothetical protein
MTHEREAYTVIMELKTRARNMRFFGEKTNHPELNEDVVGAILEFLPREELLEYRKISKRWNKVVLRELTPFLQQEWQTFYEIIASLTKNEAITRQETKNAITQAFQHESLSFDNNPIQLRNILNERFQGVHTHRRSKILAFALGIAVAGLLAIKGRAMYGILKDNEYSMEILCLIVVALKFITLGIYYLLRGTFSSQSAENVADVISDNVLGDVSQQELIKVLSHFKKVQCHMNILLGETEFLQRYGEQLKQTISNFFKQRNDDIDRYHFFRSPEKPAKIIFDILIKLNEQWGNKKMVEFFSSVFKQESNVQMIPLDIKKKL